MSSSLGSAGCGSPTLAAAASAAAALVAAADADADAAVSAASAAASEAAAAVALASAAVACDVPKSVSRVSIAVLSLVPTSRGLSPVPSFATVPISNLGSVVISMPRPASSRQRPAYCRQGYLERPDKPHPPASARYQW